MEQNGIEGDFEIQIEQEPSNPINPDDEELQIVEDGSNPYKKMKLNMEGNQKRKAQDVLEISSDDNDAAGGELRHKGDQASAPQGQEEKKKKKKKSSKKEKDPDHEENGEKSEKKKDKDKSKKKKKKDKELEGEEINLEGVEKKKKKKKKKDKEKEKEKHKDGDNDEKKEKKKKKKKREEKEHAEKDKEKEKKKKKKEKEQEAKEKKMQEFEKKYPKYIQKGKIKFPIDDVLFILYDSILGEHIPKIKKPTAKSGLITPQELGDILQIWNFFTSFPELVSIRNLQQEEIYACLKYTGDEHLALLNRMHYEILFVFVREFLKKNRFETYKDEVENPFFILIKCYVGYEEPIAEELTLIWTELYKYITHLSPYGDYMTLTLKRYVENLAEKSIANYNKLEYKVKVRVLMELINAVYDTEVFRDCLQEKMDQVTNLIKERNELLQEIKQDEQEYYDLKAKVELTEKTHREEEEKWEQLARSEVIRRQKELENDKKEFQKTLSALSKVEAAKEKKQTRVEEIVASLNGNVETATRLGQDSNKSEYWIFQGHPEKLYVKLSPIVYPEDTWMFFDEKAELDQILEALNPKAIKEKALLEKLKEVIAHGQLSLKDVKIEEEGSTTTGVTAATLAKEGEKKKDELDINFWYAKILDYHPPEEIAAEEGETVRTTRRKAHELASVKPENPRPKEIKYLSLDGVKELLDRTDNTLSTYLDKWGARWANPKVKDDLRKRIKEAQTAKELAGLLVELEKNFQYSETPLRQKSLEEGADELDNPEEEEDDEEDEDDEQYYEEEKRRYEEQNRDEENFYGEDDDEEDSRHRRRGRGRSERESEADEDDIKIRRKGARRMEIEDDEEEPRIKKKGGSRKQSKYEEEDNESRRSEKESRIEEEVQSQVSHQPHKEEVKPAVETEAPALSQEEKKEGEKPAEGTETEPQEKVKKMAVKVWGRANERTRRCWMVYIKNVDNVVGLFFAASIFCDLVEIYVAKKNEKYFSEYKTVAEYMAAKRERKQNVNKPTRANEQRAQKQQKDQLDRLKQQREDRAHNRQFAPALPVVKSFQAAPDSPEGYRIKKRGAPRESSDSQARKNGGGSEANPKRIRKLRDQTSDRSESEPEDDYNPRQEEKARVNSAKQAQLNELANVRRSTRLTRRSELPAAEPEYEEKECLDCGRTVSEEEAVICSMCENAFHLDCAGLKAVPDDKYTCINCWQKLASSRQTRSTTRKLH